MKEKIKNILEHMIQEENGWGVKSYQEDEMDGSFELKTQLSKYNHQTFLKYDFTNNSEMFRIEIMHILGYLDVSIPHQAAAGQLLRLLSHNTGSFNGTTAFIGVESGESDEDPFFATLNSFHHFLTSWSDIDIAKALSLHFFDLHMGLVTKDTKLTMLKMFGDPD